MALQGTGYEGRNEREGNVGIQQVNENEIRLKWHPFPEKKPKKQLTVLCLSSVTEQSIPLPHGGILRRSSSATTSIML